MPNVTATFFGEPGSGKSALIERFTQRAIAEDSTGVVYNIAHAENTKIQLWDLSGKHPARIHYAKTYLKGCNVCVFTVDLTNPFNREQFSAYLEVIKESAPNASLILVGCKSDLPRKIDNASFQGIMEEYGIPYGFITSSATGEGVNQLFSAIAKSGNYQKINEYVTNPVRKPSLHEPELADMKVLIHPTSPLYNAIENLEKLAAALPLVQERRIKEAIVELIGGLRDPEKDKEVVIGTFVSICGVALQEARDSGVSKMTISQISKAVLAVAAASTIAMFIASSVLSLGVVTLLIGGIVGTGVGIHLVKSGFFKTPLACAIEQIQIAANNQNTFIEEPLMELS
ncbi:Rab family GTPase [Legionella micdadei]|uniref:Small GTP-binding protein domain-containing protein n=1 Tax=Legionella micdadei TaxID=451 RepID=A0A098GDW4_LEGMI|nr:ADP-ribosylation factor-like protein [Legionella micdadei]KTD29943.1 Rho GTPase (Miro-like) [Legionella micdadei]NSL19532.1 50S ribosome-binding GTPase [Legionella micdadei]CEG60175.1 protein of unknown function [Legionella micdadei]SCY63981.1 small GTP-binding protein domain-containing protein [Legionella micdadei]